MIDIAQLTALIALGLFGYFVYLFKEFVESYQRKEFTDYDKYKKTISNSHSFIRPKRDNSDTSIHEIRGDNKMITTKKSNGLRETTSSMVDIDKADPADVMAYIDAQFPETKVV